MTKQEIMSSSQDNDHGQADLGVVYDLIESRQWEGVIEFFRTNPEASKTSRLSNFLSDGNFPLHEVCRQQPPLDVVNLLLEWNEEAVQMRGQHGYLPLHFACASGASYDVVARLIDVHPAATRCRDELDDALPLHFAAQWGASEEVLMEIVTTHPEGSFIRDASGKTPMDHAKKLPPTEAREYAITALETAPILVATAKAASKRVNQELDMRIKGTKEAHAEFIRQLEERQDDEKTEFLQMEVQFHNDLAEEKERNIELAEMVLKLHKREIALTEERDGARKRLEKERYASKSRLETQEGELRSILNSMEPFSDQEDNGGIVQQVSDLARMYQESKSKNVQMRKDVNYNQEMVHHLGSLLSNKDGEIQKLNRKLQENELAQHTGIQRTKQLASSKEETEQALNSTKGDLNRLKSLTDAQKRQLQDANRMVHVQENRLGSIKSLVASLSYNIESWAMDDEEWDQKTSATPGSTIVEGLETLNKQKTSSLRSSSRHERLDFPPVATGTPEKVYNSDRSSLGRDTRYSSDKSMMGETNDTAMSTKPNDYEEEDMSTLTTCVSPARPMLHRQISPTNELDL
jgi:hypothetical protein